MRSPAIDARYVLALMGFLGVMNVYLSRLNLSIAIVAMIKPPTQSSSEQDLSGVVIPENDYCPAPQEAEGEGRVSSLDDPLQGEYDWDPGVRGDVLASYYYGYIWTQIPGGWLTNRFGFRRVFGISMVSAGLLTLLAPYSAALGLGYFIACRVLVGFSHGVVFPAMHGAWTHWAHPNEASWMVSFHVAGCSVGSVLVFPLGGLLASQWGWRSVFYCTGALSLIWALLWFLLVHDSPAKHPRISQRERSHILAGHAESGGRSRVTRTPWKDIVTSVPVWALTAGHVASNWGNYQLNSMMPTYLNDVLKIDIKTNGFLTALPFLLQSLICLLAGYVTDAVRSRGLLRTLTVRKINTGLGLLVPAASIVLAGYMGCNSVAAITFFVVSAGFNTFTVPGCKTSMLDFAPRFSSVIMGFSNTWANFTGFLAPQTTGHLVKANNSLSGWQLAFWISALVYVPGFIVFLVWGSDQLQPWACEDEGDKDGNEVKEGENDLEYQPKTFCAQAAAAPRL